MNTSLDSSFGKKDTLCLKGLLCLVILLHHILQFAEFNAHTPLGHLLYCTGPWAATVFLFISGYGLMVSYDKNESYVDSFIKKRFLPLYIKYLLFVLVYAIYDFNKDISYLKLLLTSVTWGGTIVSFGWFFQMLFFMYLGFFFCFKFPQKKITKYICYAAFIIFYILIAWRFAQKTTPVPSFAVGCIFGIFKERIEQFIKKYRIAIMALSTITIYLYFLIIYIRGVIQVRYPISPLLYDSTYSLSCVAICIFAYCFTTLCHDLKIPIINNLFLSYIGRISLEIYCLQGLVLRLLYKYISNRTAYILVSITIIMAGSIIINKIYVFICKKKA